MNLENQVALVTGGGRAIGKAISLRLARHGADVVLFGLDQAALEQTAEEIRRLGRQVLAVEGDVRIEQQIAHAVGQASLTLGAIDILINNAGIIGPTAMVPDVALDEWNDVLAVNLTGAFLCSKLVAPEMIRRRRGKIINIASIAGKIAYPLRSPYAVSKWGLIGLTMTLAKELGEYNIQVNAICPGPVAGQRMQAIIEQRAQEITRSTEEVHAQYIETTALRRMVNEQDVAAMVAYLASAEADNITAQALDVSAGYGL